MIIQSFEKFRLGVHRKECLSKALKESLGSKKRKGKVDHEAFMEGFTKAFLFAHVMTLLPFFHPKGGPTKPPCLFAC